MKTKFTTAGFCLFASLSLFVSVSAAPVINADAQLSKPSPSVIKPFTVSLLYFTGVLDKQGLTNLEWATDKEDNCSHFVIEKSTDLKTFTPVAEVTTEGNGHQINIYNFIDPVPVRSIVFYKLIQFDNDGKWTELDMVTVRARNKR